MKKISINEVADLESVSNLHPKLKEMIAAAIALAWDADIDFSISRNAIQINFTPNLESNSSSNFDFIIAYRNNDEAT